MTQFGNVTSTASLDPIFVEGADPETLQNLVNEVLLNVDGTTTFITSITLAGAGDGHTFVVIIETAAGTDVEFGGLFGTAGGLQATQVRCYMGGSPEAFLAAKTAAGEPAPFASVPFGIVDEQLAGGAKGQVFMGMTVFSSNAQGVGLSEPRARGIISVNQAIAGGTTILTFDSIANANGFALADAGQTLQYTGQRAIFAHVEASVTVNETGANDVTVSIVQDPLGAATVLADAVTHTAAGEFDNVSVLGFAPLTPFDAALSKLGLQVVAGGAGFVRSATLRVSL